METINKQDFTMDFSDYAEIIFCLGILEGLRANFENRAQRAFAENAIVGIVKTLDKYVSGDLGERQQLKTEVNEDDECES